MLRLRGGLCVIGAAAILAAPSAAWGAELIGQTATPVQNCGQNFPYVQSMLTGGTPYSPTSYGVITSWSHQGDSMVTRTVQLLVLRPNPAAGATHFIATGKDQVRTTPAGQLNTFRSGVRLAIEPTERLGLYIPGGQPDNNGGCAFILPAGGNVNFPAAMGDPPLNTSVDYSGTIAGHRLNASALVEPDTDRDVFGDESQDNCIGTAGTANGCPNTVTLGKATAKGNKVTVEVTAPGAGTLAAGSASDKKLAGAAAKKKKKAQPPLKQASQTLTSKTKQTVALTLRLSKSGKAKLAQKGKLGLSIKVVYTPTGGTPGSVTTKAKLRKKGKKG
jgi:hypothetical protein